LLSSADERTSQDTKRKRESDGHSRTVERRRTDNSGHQDKAREGGALTNYRAQMRDKSGRQDNARERGALTSCRAQTEGQVRTLRESERARGTNFLSRADGGVIQDTKTKRESKGYSRTVERR
jgi:hypothetical protein